MFEFGCGTGRLAERLLHDHLPEQAIYTAVDISNTMFRLTRERLAQWPSLTEAYRPAVQGGCLAMVRDRVQRAGEIVHLVAAYLEDLTHWLDLLTPDQADARPGLRYSSTSRSSIITDGAIRASATGRQHRPGGTWPSLRPHS